MEFGDIIFSYLNVKNNKPASLLVSLSTPILTYFIWDNALLGIRVTRLEEIEEKGREAEEEK